MKSKKVLEAEAAAYAAEDAARAATRSAEAARVSWKAEGASLESGPLWAALDKAEALADAAWAKAYAAEGAVLSAFHED